MRHGDKINNLSRTASHRRALLSNLANQLIEHKRVFTTLAKAKALRVYVEPLLTRAKNDNTHNRRVVFSYLQNKESIKELFGTIGDKIADRPGGYTRVVKMPRRFGDAADMAMIELVDFNEIYRLDKETGKKKTRRSRRSSSGKKAAASVSPATAEETPQANAQAAMDTAEATAPVESREETPVADQPEAPAAEGPSTPEGNTEEGEGEKKEGN